MLETVRTAAARVWSVATRPISFGSRTGVSTADETRVASRGKRNPFEAWSGRLPNPDPTLRKFAGGRRIGLYSLIFQEFSFVGGLAAQWVDHVLRTGRQIKAATCEDPAKQEIADEAAKRATAAWNRVQNRDIVLQKLLMGRFYGFSRAEKVWRFDEVVREWIPDLYNVPWEAWNFDDNLRDFLITWSNPMGIEVDPKKFIHFQWGSADTKYGEGELSEVYLTLWKIQKIEELALQALEDWSRLVAIVHIPRGFSKEDRAKSIAGVKEQYRFYFTVPSDEDEVRVDTPNGGVTANGTAGRQEFNGVEFYERWVQIRFLGTPQTQSKGGAGNGKLDEVRSEYWDDKSPISNAGLDKVLNEQWLDDYCDVNLADVPVELRPYFESDPGDIAKGLQGAQAATYLELCRSLAANEIPAHAAEEGFASLGITRPRAKSIAFAIVKDRDKLAKSQQKPNGTPPATTDQQATPQQEAA
jgi:hypothetical protein